MYMVLQLNFTLVHLSLEYLSTLRYFNSFTHLTSAQLQLVRKTLKFANCRFLFFLHRQLKLRVCYKVFRSKMWVDKENKIPKKYNFKILLHTSYRIVPHLSPTLSKKTSFLELISFEINNSTLL